jgi:hypothetical protein
MTGHAAVIDPASMAASSARSRAIRFDTLGWPAKALVEDVLAGYAEWRDGADAVADAYERWSAAPPDEYLVRFAAVIAALDQEQTAADGYAEAIRKLERSLPPVN